MVVLLSSVTIHSKKVSAETNIHYLDKNTNKIVTTTEKKFLEKYGVYKKKTFYKGYDDKGDLAVELYFDAKTKKGCGISYYYNKPFGFEIDSYRTQKNFFYEKYSLMPIMNDSKFSPYSEEISNYKEEKTYKFINKKQRLINYTSTGIFSRDETEKIVVMDFSYGKDGKLISKLISVNSYILGSYRSSSDIYYDKLERPIYSKSYITHGSLLDFYIYDGNSKIPNYILTLDDNLGVINSGLTKITK
jgi:hypothetical protein